MTTLTEALKQHMAVDENGLRGVMQQEPDDCVRACVASLFGLALHDVPRFSAHNWGAELDTWLWQYGYTSINMVLGDSAPDNVPKGYSLGGIPTKNATLPKDWKHCVVCLDGKIVFDPIHGDQPGAETAEEYTLIYPLRPNTRASDPLLLEYARRLEIARENLARVVGKEIGIHVPGDKSEQYYQSWNDGEYWIAQALAAITAPFEGEK